MGTPEGVKPSGYTPADDIRMNLLLESSVAFTAADVAVG